MLELTSLSLDTCSNQLWANEMPKLTFLGSITCQDQVNMCWRDARANIFGLNNMLRLSEHGME